MAKIYADLIRKGIKTIDDVPDKLKDVCFMAVIYATLIIKGVKTFADVPDKIKDKVREVLVALDCPELAE